MKKLSLFISVFCFAVLAQAQDFTIISSVKEYGDYKTKIKFGRDVNYQTENVYEMKNANGDMYYSCLKYGYENFTKGSTHELMLGSSGPDIAAGTKMMILGSTTMQDAASRFKASSGTAFVGSNSDYSAYINDGITGSVKTGDKVQCFDEDKKTIDATITSLAIVTPSGRAVIKAIDERFKLTNGFSLEIQFTCTGGKSPGGKFTFQASNGATAATSTSTAPATFSGKREVTSKNISISDGTIKITLNNLVKYYPKQSESPVFKIDESIDYYILDVTIENISSKEIDAGEYVLHLNLYDASGINSDDHGRLFKNTGGDASTQKDVDAVDQKILGGTSALRYATVLTLYTSQDPSYSKENYDAAWGKLKPGAKVSCNSVKAIGVPKSYKPTEIGFWHEDVKKTSKTKL